MTWEMDDLAAEEVLELAAGKRLEHLAAVRQARAELFEEMAEDYEWMEEPETWQ